MHALVPFWNRTFLPENRKIIFISLSEVLVWNHIIKHIAVISFSCGISKHLTYGFNMDALIRLWIFLRTDHVYMLFFTLACMHACMVYVGVCYNNWDSDVLNKGPLSGMKKAFSNRMTTRQTLELKQIYTPCGLNMIGFICMFAWW